MKSSLAGKLIAFLLLATGFLLIYNPFAKFPYNFCTIIAFILLATWLQDKNWQRLNFKKIGGREIKIILICYGLLELSMDFIFQPLVNKIFGETADYSAFEMLQGNNKFFFKYLFHMWLSAAVGEELLFRAFVFAQCKKIIGNKPVIIIFSSAILFAMPHLYQGNVGLLITFLFGLAFGYIYHRFQNIWINIIVHGLIDTVFLVLSYYGLLEFYNLYGQ